MSLGEWLKSLSALDQVILLALYSLCIYLSKVTLEMLIEYYDEKKEHLQITAINKSFMHDRMARLRHLKT